MTPDLKVLLNPSSVALVGASRSPGSLSGMLLSNLLEGGFIGAVYPVNPKYSELSGVRCYRSLRQIPEPVDLVLVMLPGHAVGDVIDECGEIGAGVVVLFGSGFGEVGEEGAKAEAELVTRARRAGVRLLGPNCQGVVISKSRLLASFTPAIRERTPRPGPVAYVGQSGALGGTFLDKAGERHVPVGRWVSTGNQADLTTIEVAKAVLAQDDISVVSLYVEDVEDGRGFIDLARNARDLGKEVIVVRSGQSEVGRRAIRSHTGAMVSPHVAFEVVARAEGLYLAHDIDEMLDLVVALLPTQRPRGSAVGIVSSSGGGGILVAERFTEHGFSIPEFDENLQHELRKTVPPFGSTLNPVDVTAQLFSVKDDEDSFGPRFRELCSTVAASEQVDILVIVLTMLIGDLGVEMAEALDGLQSNVNKPVFVVWLASANSTVRGRQQLAHQDIPVYLDIMSAARAIRALIEHHATRRTSDGSITSTASPRASELTSRILGLATNPAGSYELLDLWNIPQPAWAIASDVSLVKQIAVDLGGPFALKILAKGIQHKSEVGGVMLDVDEDQVVACCQSVTRELTDRGVLDSLQGFLIQRMAPEGLELLVSVRDAHPNYPPLLTVGVGGIATELYADIATAPLPISRSGIEDLLSTLRGSPLLGWFRGQQPKDVRSLITMIQMLTDRFFDAQDLLTEVEINPVVVHVEGAGVSAVDCLVDWKTSSGSQPMDKFR